MATIREDFSNGDIIVYTINSIPSVTTDDWYLDSVSSSNANVVATKIDDENFTLAINSVVSLNSTLSLVIGYRDNGTPNYVATRNISVDWVGTVVTDFIIQNTDSSAVTVTVAKGSINNLNFSYKLNGESNYTTSTDTVSITIPVGRKLYMHSDTMTHWGGSSSAASNKIGISGSVSFSGNIMGLLANNTFSNDDYAFAYLFENCTSITTTPVLPATTLKSACYKDMFSGCTGLTTISGLPATQLASYCYQNMFKGCTSLTTTPTLAATTLTTGCYDSMFYGCSGLTTAPTLPATTLTQYCYQNMFNGCTSLTTTPELKALTLSTSCYYQMFYGCSSLNSITLYATNISATQCLYNWVYGVAATGTFEKMTEMTSLPTGDSGIPTGWTVTDIIIEAEPLKFTLTNDSSSGTITLQIDSGLYATHYEYTEWSLDKINWTRVDNVSGTQVNVTTSTLQPGDSVYFRGMGKGTAYDSSKKSTFIFSSGVKATCDGNVMSLIGKNEYYSLLEYCFYSLFNSCVGLITSPELPATTLANYCYQAMFWGCTSLTTAPELPATTLGTSCYQQMFWGCTSLTTAPTTLPATKLVYHCYRNMFRECTSLTTAPTIYAITLATECCEGMFSGCTSLTTAPSILPATTLAQSCYSGMFYSCTSLTTAPELPATTLVLNCYYNMFNRCINLNYIKCLATDISASYCVMQWVRDVQTTSGTFVKDPNMNDWTTGNDGIPNNWTVVNDTAS